MTAENNKPQFIQRDAMISDKKYVEWLTHIKQRLQRGQIKAAIQVNTTALEFNWSLGRDLVEMKAEQTWGKGVMKQLSLDLRRSNPEIRGLSMNNLYLMRRWYEFYKPAFTEHSELFYQAGKIIEMPQLFGLVPWRHHVEIIYHCKSVDEALFYVHQVVDGNWSRSHLKDELSSRLYERQGKALTNFSRQPTLPQGALAQDILKDPYDFSFLSMSKDYTERDLENALVENIARFLLELGRGFAFIGRQMELQMPNGRSYFPDLIFYHVRLKCYVVVELKIVEFIPEFAGKLNFYVSAADELLKQEDDNPSIGLLVCRGHDKTTVEWSFRGIDRPIGVASYQLEEVVVRTIAEMEENNKKQKGGNE